ncbi:MAG: hypothetical protein HYV07_01420 [Deltaproteobacteria bacterium]|nr:hypothetical protein [Deltaproteobacteria bacterium]
MSKLPRATPEASRLVARPIAKLRARVLGIWGAILVAGISFDVAVLESPERLRLKNIASKLEVERTQKTAIAHDLPKFLKATEELRERLTSLEGRIRIGDVRGLLEATGVRVLHTSRIEDEDESGSRRPSTVDRCTTQELQLESQGVEVFARAVESLRRRGAQFRAARVMVSRPFVWASLIVYRSKPLTLERPKLDLGTNPLFFRERAKVEALLEDIERLNLEIGEVVEYTSLKMRLEWELEIESDLAAENDSAELAIRMFGGPDPILQNGELVATGDELAVVGWPSSPALSVLTAALPEHLQIHDVERTKHRVRFRVRTASSAGQDE